MANNKFQTITANGVLAKFEEALGASRRVYESVTQTINVTGPDQTHVWLGNVPQPSQRLGSAVLSGIREFSFNVANQEYVLVFLIDQNSIEDDQQNLIDQKISDASGVWAIFKDAQLSTLLQNGGTDTAWDGNAFFHDTRQVGSSGALDNNFTGSTTSGLPSATDMLNFASTANAGMLRLKDDQGNDDYNSTASTKKVLIVPAEYEKAAVEAVSSSIIANTSNAWGMNFAEPKVLPNLPDSDNIIYLAYVGDANRMPFIYQERTPLQITVSNSDEAVAQNHGVLVTARQRYRLGYGEFRRCSRLTVTES